MEFFVPGPSWKIMEVIEKSTGKKISIKDFRFNPEYHERIGTGGGKIEINTSNLDPEKDNWGEKRFEELKVKGWKNLSAEERKEYKSLKPKK